MNTWHVTVGFTATASFDEDTPFDISEALNDYAASMSVSRDFSAGDIILTMEANTAIEATEKASNLVRKTLTEYEIDADLVSLITQSETEFQKELATPIFPEVVGFAEIAEMASVSRQRASQFPKIESFPAPVIETAQGPLMSKSAIAKWIETRNTRPGRRKAVPA